MQYCDKKGDSNGESKKKRHDAIQQIKRNCLSQLQKKMDWMPTITPGYITSQKIIHTLQFMIYEGDSWAYQILKNHENLPKEYKKWVKEYERKKA